MPSLHDIQGRVRDALLTGRTSALDGLLRGERHPEQRLAIHQRHYRASLVTSILERFPATVWLVGSDFVTAAAEAFVSDSPPVGPCIAEYGGDFPSCMAALPGASALPYLQPFAELEWHLARVSLAVDLPSMSMDDLHAIGAEGLAAARLVLQPGLHHVRMNWAIDDLISLYLTDQSPDSFMLAPVVTHLEVHGSRGALRMTRLSPADFTFRAALAAGTPLGEALAAAVNMDPAFDPGRALLEITSMNFITAVHPAGGAEIGGLCDH